MSFYLEWGFAHNPFAISALPASETGRRLLVGRDAELMRLTRALKNPPRIPTLEGPNGVGKTSLANVAAYVCYDTYCETGVGPFLIPCNRAFQMPTDRSVDAFSSEVLMEVAQTLISRREEIRLRGRIAPNLKAIDKWLNSPYVSGWELSGGLLGGAAGVGRSTQANESSGFERSGFKREVLAALNDIFGGGEGVVCVIDNLELLETSEAARKTLEHLRDALLYVPGLRWIVAGASGIVKGVASSPRLDGSFANPIDVEVIDSAHARMILSSRVEAFRTSEDDAPYLPMLVDDFVHLYEMLAGNIRSTLSYTDEYCMSVVDDPPRSDDEKHDRYCRWLDTVSDDALRSIDRLVTKRGWSVLDRACELDIAGYFSPSEFELFGFNDMPNLRRYIKDLAAAGLVSVSRDDSDKRRKTIQVVAKGWLINYARKKTAPAKDSLTSR